MLSVDDLKACRNVGYTPAQTEQALWRLLAETAAKLSREDFAISEHDLGLIRSGREAAKKLLDRHFDAMEATYAERRENLLTYSNIKFVSLGSDCFPRTLPTRWGFKPPAKLGEKIHVFDLANHSIKAVRRLIETDFDRYLVGLHKPAESAYAINSEIGFQLIHELDQSLFADDLKELRARYVQRIDNFRSEISAAPRLMFILHTFEADWNTAIDIRAIRNALCAKRRGLETGFFWIHTPQFGDRPALAPVLPRDIRFTSRPYPFKGYVWHHPHSTFSLRGIEFEKQIVVDLKAFISQLGWVTKEPVSLMA